MEKKFVGQDKGASLENLNYHTLHHKESKGIFSSEMQGLGDTSSSSETESPKMSILNQDVK